MRGKTVHFWIGCCSFFVHILYVLPSTPTYAQFGNEWINFNQSYYKISVLKKGIHQLTYADLVTAGFPVNSVDPRRIQIFRRGVEQSIRFKSLQLPENGIFESGEYLEFYGEKNDGVTDVDLYKNPAHHPHTYINLYSDTAAYFLTWNLLAIQGKRMAEPTPINNVDALPPESGANSTALHVLYDNYSGGLIYGEYIQNSFFDEGEGWTGPVICTLNSGCTGQQDFTLTIPKGVTSLSPPQLEVLLVGRAEVEHAFEIYAGPDVSTLRLITSSTFSAFQNYKSNAALQWSDVAGNGNVVVRVKGLGVGGIRESLSVSYLKIDYLRDFDLNGVTSLSFKLQPNAGNKSYIEIQNPPAGLRLFDVTDQTSSILIGTYSQGANMAAIVSGTNASRNIFATTEIISPSVKKVSFRQINPTSNNYIIISHESLHKPGLGYADPVKAYGAYRASAEGGSYDTLIVNSSQLYNQFNYGETSARAIYQFLKFVNNGGKTKYLFLIGKGLELNFSYDRNRVFLPTDLKDLVPTGGYPGSDLVFSAGLNGTTYEPAIPTGRLTATTPTDVAAYLDKVKETEQLPYDNLWRKNFLHLSGGLYFGEPEVFRSYVEEFKSIAEEVYMGAQVEIKSKKTFNLENIPIADQVNSGLSLITFFGHSNTNILDFEVGFVTNPTYGFNNPGKYPAFLINGCSVGRIFDNRTGTQRSFGEDWILAQNKGAKAFIANSSFAYASALRKYSDLFYTNAFGNLNYFTKGIGDVQVKVAKDLFDLNGATTFNLSHLQQMVLMGDPAVPVFGAPKPDYFIQNDFLNKVSLDGNPITTKTPSFGIQYKIQNFGQVSPDPLKVKLIRILPDNSTLSYDTIISPVYYEEEFVFVVKNDVKSGGTNSFIIQIDSDNDQAELNEQNNQATLDLFIPASSTFNLVPYNYSVVNSSSVELIFQNINQLPSYRDYQIEIDTVPEFNSSFLIQKKIGANVLGKVTVDLASSDSAVYYWRTKLDQPLPSESSEWFTSSFTYVKDGPEGWAQSSVQQIQENQFVALEVDQNTEAYNFPGYPTNVFIQNFGSANANPYTATSFKVNNEEFNVSQFQLCRLNTICMVGFDKNTGNPYAALPLSYLDARTCGKDPQVINNFTLVEAEVTSGGLADAITNLDVSDSVILFTIGDAGVQNWSSTLLTKLEEIGIGASELAGFQTGEPMIVFGKKGVAPGLAKVIRPSATPVNEQELITYGTITAKPISGSMRSVEIGPARAWHSLSYRASHVDPSDVYTISVIGVSLDKQESVLYSGNDKPIDLSFIDPASFPFIKIEIQTSDDIDQTPVYLDHWFVDYAPSTEGILLYRGNIEPVSLFEGQMWNGKFSYINLTKHDFIFGSIGDSLANTLKVPNLESGNIFTQTFQKKSPAPFDSIQYEININTVGKAGTNSIQLFVNETGAPEQHTFNNTIVLENILSVIADKQPPTLDVTVDDRYLINGDDVSPTPKVQIKIIDDNQYYFKTDTLDIDIKITNLDTENSRRINFSDPSLTWSPASLEDDFVIEFTTFLTAGEYELSVQGVDASGNESGAKPYQVTFKVTDETKVMLGNPYPNPSNSSFAFPIEISGNSLPESFQLKIYGPEGRLVKQFELVDVSGFYIGTNHIKWNTTELKDSWLPTGLYYYTIDVSISGDRYSKSGKLLLIRP